MPTPTDQPREWVAITLTLAADTRDELDEVIEEFADSAFRWQDQPVDAFARFQCEAHVWAAFGTQDWVECP